MYTEGGDGTHTGGALTANRQRVQRRQRWVPIMMFITHCFDEGWNVTVLLDGSL